MNTRPVELCEGAAAIFTFAAQEGAVKGSFGVCVRYWYS